MKIPKSNNHQSNIIGDFNGDSLPDWVGVAELLHLLLLQNGTQEELDAHRRDSLSRCELCDASMRLVSWIVKAKSAPNAVAGLSAPPREPSRVSSTARMLAADCEDVGISGL
jgi:hypothetical protein